MTAEIKPPCYAVIFTSRQKTTASAYAETAARMRELAAAQPGYLGIESVHDEAGFGITVSYWESLDAIAAWKANLEHRLAQAQGQNDWYESYEVRVARVERAYSFGPGKKS